MPINTFKIHNTFENTKLFLEELKLDKLILSGGDNRGDGGMASSNI